MRDFITVLFAFFVVLFASAYHENQSIKKVSNALHHGSVDMESFPGKASDPDRTHAQLVSDRSASHPVAGILGRR